MTKLKQRGFTLIELMISLVLGMTVIAGISQLFIQSQQSFRLQRNLSYMMDDASYALEILRQSVVLTGYSSLGSTDAQNSVDNAYVFSGDADVLGSTLTLNDREFIKGSTSDFVYRFQIDDSGALANSPATSGLDASNLNSTTGLDNTNGKPMIVTVRLFLEDSDGSLNLAYRSKIESSVSNINPSKQSLLPNVANMYVRYGIDTDADKSANFYTDSTDVSDWTQVVAVKIFLVIQSEDENVDRICAKKVIKIDDVDSFTPTDCRLYRLFSTTVAFRNKLG